ncbi:unnamed protein product [Linum tenue]|uniref:Uncharacterized protein n=1 Tax=Linum tenue TaxID=586396 RepID=A0AAV0JT85_9ROSI|nr:unnamed protein product [Linum tenue]
MHKEGRARNLVTEMKTLPVGFSDTPSFHLADHSESFLPFPDCLCIIFPTVLSKCSPVRTLLVPNIPRLHEVENGQQDVAWVLIQGFDHERELFEAPFAGSIALGKDWDVDFGFVNSLDEGRSNLLALSELFVIVEGANLGMGQEVVERIGKSCSHVGASEAQENLVISSWKRSPRRRIGGRGG